MPDHVDSNSKIGLLFVCLGNICRSPLAEGVFIHLARERACEHRFHVQSAGTGSWHIGKRPDPRSIAIARAHGVELPSRAQQVDPVVHFARFDWLIPMDLDNRETLISLGAPPDRVRLLRCFDPELEHQPDHARQVPDPYYGGEEGFAHVYSMVHRACAGLLDHLLR